MAKREIKINHNLVFLILERLKTSILCLLLTVLCQNIYTQETTKNKKDNGIVLIIASYNPDTKKMSGFINEFQNTSIENKYDYNVLIEDLGCRGIDESTEWSKRINKTLEKYKDKNLKGIILLGQEAWASFLGQKTISHDIPFFSCFTSENGIELPDSSIKNWEPEYINTKEKASEIGVAGGFLNSYDLGKNIDLIKMLYPNVDNIAFVSDNSYGGVSIQAFVKKEMSEKFPDMTLTLIDGRKKNVDTIIEDIGNLPSGSVILLGTWRIDNNGLYFMPNTTNLLTSKNPNIPVFSLSGTGIGTIAIGGYIPDYQASPKEIAKSIYDYHNGDTSAIKFNSIENKYVFDRLKIKEYGINDYHLPENSTFVSNLEEKIKQYRDYATISIIVASLLAIFLIVLFKLYFNIKRLKNSLEKNRIELIEAKNRAEESERLKTSFLANMSHEIRTPLNAIVGFSNLISENNYNANERKQFCSIISKNSDLLLTLINDILDISRLETDKIKYKFMDEDIYTLCKQVLSSIEHLRKPNISYLFNPGVDRFILNTDRQRISQVLINFITNANKFTEHGSITLGYDVDKSNNKIIFHVTDTGTGIPLEQQARIFNRFEKLDEFKQGTGLGLTICKQIALKFGGDVWIDSSYTGGARFMFSHPIQRNKSV